MVYKPESRVVAVERPKGFHVYREEALPQLSQNLEFRRAVRDIEGFGLVSLQSKLNDVYVVNRGVLLGTLLRTFNRHPNLAAFPYLAPDGSEMKHHYVPLTVDEVRAVKGKWMKNKAPHSVVQHPDNPDARLVLVSGKPVGWHVYTGTAQTPVKILKFVSDPPSRTSTIKR